MIITYINIVILIILALIHIYWAIGGKKGYRAAIPTNSNGKAIFRTNAIAALAVAVALICFAYFHYAYIMHAGKTVRPIIGYLLLAGSIVFFIRVIGDFKYSGLFKKTRNTSYARYDTLIYTPLCAIISIFALITYFK
jgi:hypothetical protein